MLWKSAVQLWSVRGIATTSSAGVRFPKLKKFGYHVYQHIPMVKNLEPARLRPVKKRYDRYLYPRAKALSQWWTTPIRTGPEDDANPFHSQHDYSFLDHRGSHYTTQRQKLARAHHARLATTAVRYLNELHDAQQDYQATQDTQEHRKQQYFANRPKAKGTTSS